LETLDKPVPYGYATWTGPLLAKEMGDVSEYKVWRILHRLNISLTRRHSWCVSTDPEFVPKAAAIVGLYLNPPDNAVVLSVDEKTRDTGSGKGTRVVEITGWQDINRIQS